MNNDLKNDILFEVEEFVKNSKGNLERLSHEKDIHDITNGDPEEMIKRYRKFIKITLENELALIKNITFLMEKSTIDDLRALLDI